MNTPEFSQLSIGIATLVILWIVVRFFIETMTKKDDQIMSLVTSFNATVNDKIRSDIEYRQKETEAIEALTKAIHELRGEIKTKNGGER